MFFQKDSSWCSSRVFAFFLMVVWMAVIFFFSMLSGKLIAGDPPVWYFIERKGAHVVEYALLTLLAYRYFRLLFPREAIKKVLWLATGFSLMYATTDELHQFFVPNRGAKITDVLIDGGGILLMTAFLWGWKKRQE